MANPVFIEFTGYVCKGLLLHKDLQKQHQYTISHIASGIPVLAQFRVSKVRALQALEVLASLIDWTKQDPIKAYMTGLSQEIGKVAKLLY
jgi:hypothetical protein